MKRSGVSSVGTGARVGAWGLVTNYLGEAAADGAD